MGARAVVGGDVKMTKKERKRRRVARAKRRERARLMKVYRALGEEAAPVVVLTSMQGEMPNLARIGPFVTMRGR